MLLLFIHLFEIIAFYLTVVHEEEPNRHEAARAANAANGERVFQPVFVHGLENPCSVRYDHFLYKRSSYRQALREAARSSATLPAPPFSAPPQVRLAAGAPPCLPRPAIVLHRAQWPYN